MTTERRIKALKMPPDLVNEVKTDLTVGIATTDDEFIAAVAKTKPDSVLIAVFHGSVCDNRSFL